MPSNIERLLIIMELTLQDILQTSFVIPLYPTTFTEISVPVPPAPGISGLPSLIYFDIDNRFSTEQRQRIKDSISGVLFNWQQHIIQKWSGGINTGISQLASCTNTYATRNFRPTWYRGLPIQNGLAATNIAMDQFTQLIKDNGLRKSPRARIFSNIPFPINSSTIFALTALRQSKVSLSFIINPLQLAPSVSNGLLLGSMFHAWLHRAGYYDPKTTSYFISECPMCVMRAYQPKNPLISDIQFYKYFD